MLPLAPRKCDTYPCRRPAEFGLLHCALHQRVEAEREREALERLRNTTQKKGVS